MTTLPNNWTDEDRVEIVEEVVDGMIREMTFEDMRRTVWDLLYDDLIFQDWPDLWSFAEQYAPELVERFQDPAMAEC